MEASATGAVASGEAVGAGALVASAVDVGVALATAQGPWIGKPLGRQIVADHGALTVQQRAQAVRMDASFIIAFSSFLKKFSYFSHMWWHHTTKG